jgi:hypothetical protein
VIRAGMVAKLAKAKQERNAALLKVIKKEGALGRFSEQLQSECQVLAPSSPFLRNRHDLWFLFVFQRSKPSWSSCRCLGSRTCPP